MNPLISFDTSSIRQPLFNNRNNTPGPGSYNSTRPKTGPLKAHKITSRRFAGPNSYFFDKGTSVHIGPGSYHY